jgi:hypothetical protein
MLIIRISIDIVIHPTIIWVGLISQSLWIIGANKPVVGMGRTEIESTPLS